MGESPGSWRGAGGSQVADSRPFKSAVSLPIHFVAGQFRPFSHLARVLSSTPRRRARPLQWWPRASPPQVEGANWMSSRCLAFQLSGSCINRSTASAFRRGRMTQFSVWRGRSHTWRMPTRSSRGTSPRQCSIERSTGGSPAPWLTPGGDSDRRLGLTLPPSQTWSRSTGGGAG